MNWHNITYPAIFQNTPALWLWGKLCCPRGWHLFDEWLGTCLHNSDEECKREGCNGHGHAIICDACGLEIDIRTNEERSSGA